MICAAHKILCLWSSRRMRWAGHVACVGQKTSDYRILVGKREGKRPLGRRRSRWKDIEIDLKETGSVVVDTIHQAHDKRQLACCCEHGNEPSGSCDCVQFLSSCCFFTLFSGKFVMFWGPLRCVHCVSEQPVPTAAPGLARNSVNLTAVFSC